MWQAPPWVRAQMAKDMAAGRWRGQAKPDTAEANGKDGKKPVPKPYMSAELREDSMHTTGVSSLPSDLVAPACLIACGRGSPYSASRELMLQVCAGDACKVTKASRRCSWAASHLLIHSAAVQGLPHVHSPPQP